ncbi:hypothetical protein BV25DRAFT_417781 [Artomyces pyxidatus]|uniref:Uncharacterized protein n=1 Tax=Artomyces pyxidatus TaxID=48021 RepID=A0ACB8T4F7_9AGAM|nr:hypothetical protein BV25DRAFT_417781 [Artomyces pyxidatus]
MYFLQRSASPYSQPSVEGLYPSHSTRHPAYSAPHASFHYPSAGFSYPDVRYSYPVGRPSYPEHRPSYPEVGYPYSDTYPVPAAPSPFPDFASDILTSEARYRFALAEVQAAEEEYAARVSLARAREEAVLRQRAVAAERERRAALAAQAEVARARQFQVEVERARIVKAQQQLLQRKRALQERQILQAVLSARSAAPELEEAAEPRGRTLHFHAPPTATRPRRGSPPSRPHEQSIDLIQFLRLLSSPSVAHSHTEAAAPAQQKREAPRQPLEHDEDAAALHELLEFLHGTAAAAREHEQPEVPRDVKGKGKAPAPLAPTPETVKASLEQRLETETDQEIEDTLRAIILSLADQGRAARNAGSQAGASSSKVCFTHFYLQYYVLTRMIQVKLDGADLERSSALAGAAAARAQASFQAHRAATSASPSASRNASPMRSVPTPPPSPLVAIRTVRTALLNLKAPAPNDADAVRGYEHALEGLLARLDAVESEGDEEVRDVRREVVHEVEKALEALDRGEKKSVEEEVKGYDVDVQDEVAVEIAAAPAVQEPTTEDRAPSPDTSVSADPSSDVLEVSHPESPVSVNVTEHVLEHVPESDPVPETVLEIAPEATPAAVNVAPAVPEPETFAPAAAAELIDTDASSTTILPIEPTATPESVSVTPAPSEDFLSSLSHDRFTFPPRHREPEPESDDAVLVHGGEEDAVKSADEWSEVDA